MLGGNLRTVCQSFTADGTYDLRLDFFDEAGIPNRPRGTCISLVALRPPRRGADAGDSDAGGAAIPAQAAVPAEAARYRPWIRQPPGTWYDLLKHFPTHRRPTLSPLQCQ